MSARYKEVTRDAEFETCVRYEYARYWMSVGLLKGMGKKTGSGLEAVARAESSRVFAMSENQGPEYSVLPRILRHGNSKAI
eukprot:4701085-Pleurochrysis_carterae.AAC.1